MQRNTFNSKVQKPADRNMHFLPSCVQSHRNGVKSVDILAYVKAKSTKIEYECRYLSSDISKVKNCSHSHTEVMSSHVITRLIPVMQANELHFSINTDVYFYRLHHKYRVSTYYNQGPYRKICNQIHTNSQIMHHMNLIQKCTLWLLI